jgi:ABC-type transport system involved in multi-copper enzyme maturation permease subunit
MTVRLAQSTVNGTWLRWVVNPIFGNDLRVASRRGRSYALWFAYVMLLGLLIVTLWGQVMGHDRPGITVKAQMAEAGKFITATIVWFQFIALPLVAVVLTSTTVSEEVNSRTLGVLMTTPLSSRQFVIGKLLGRLLQVVFLVATSFPLLAIIRILGGVSWSFLLQGLCITLASTIFVASVSLFFSSLCRRAHTAVVASTLCLAFLLAGPPFLCLLLVRGTVLQRNLVGVCSYVNPVALLVQYTEYMSSPRISAVVGLAAPISCLAFLLIGAGLFLRSATRLVRQVALRRAMGDPTFLTYLRHEVERIDLPSGSLRRVVGPPMIWKEMVCALSHRERLATMLAIGVEILLLFVAYTFVPTMRITRLEYAQAHLMYVWLFLGLATLFTISIPAAVICGERESRTWPLLLVTPLRDRDLLIGKFAGVLRRCGPIWLPLLAYVAGFAMAGAFHALAIVHVVLIMASVILFLCATGFYFGSRLGRTRQAVTANLITAGAVWLILPVVAQVAIDANSTECFAGVPFVQARLLVLTMLVGEERLVRGLHAGDGTLVTLACLLGYALAACVFLWRAVRAFRRHIV